MPPPLLTDWISACLWILLYIWLLCFEPCHWSAYRENKSTTTLHRAFYSWLILTDLSYHMLEKAHIKGITRSCRFLKASTESDAGILSNPVLQLFHLRSYDCHWLTDSSWKGSWNALPLQPIKHSGASALVRLPEFSSITPSALDTFAACNCSFLNQ